MKKMWFAPCRLLFHLYRLAFIAIFLLIGVVVSIGAWAACSAGIGKATINEYNNLGSNNVLGSSFVEVKLLPVPVGPSSGQAPLADISGWTLQSYSKTGKLLDTQTVSSASCAGTAYRATSIALSGDGNGYVHLLDAMGDLVDVLYADVPMPVSVVDCSLATITTDKDIQRTDANCKNISRLPDGAGDWLQSLGSGNNSEQTVCENNLDLLKVAKSASAPSLYVGETVIFTMTVSNRTQFTTLTDVAIVDALPSGLTRTAYTAPPGVIFDPAANTWSVATMTPGSSHTLTLTARADQVGSWSNSASASAHYSGDLYQSDPAIATVNVLQPLMLTKTVSPTAVPYNTAATFIVNVKNNSSTSLPFGFTVNDSVPAGLTAGTPTASSGSYAGGVWTIPSGMQAGATYTLTLPVTSQTTADSFINTATIVTPFGGPDVTASATLAVGFVVSNFNAFETTTPAGAIAGRLYTKLAATPFGLDVVAIADASQASAFNDNVKVELLANTGTPGSGYGADNCPVSYSVLQTIASAAIAGGRSTVNFSGVADAHRDVRVRVTSPSLSPSISNCSTDSFAIRPQTVTLNASPGMAIPPSAGATPTIKAGANFTLTAATGPVAGYTGALNLDSSKLTAQITSQDSTRQAGGAVGALSPASLTANQARAPGNNAKYSEVGYLYLAPGAYRDDSYTSVDRPSGCAAANSCDCVTSTIGDANLADSLSGGRYGCSIGNTVAVALGRFVPDHFEVTLSPDPPGFADSCVASAFTYLGQPFNWAATPQMTIRAMNADNVRTENYEGLFWKLADSLASYTYVDAGVPAAVLPLTPATSSQSLPATSDCNGEVTIALTESGFNYTRPGMAAPVSPFVPDVSLSVPQAGLTDTDGICYDLGAGAGCQGFERTGITGAHLRHGQIRVMNNFGPETADITRSPFEVQYYNGTGWVASVDDNCTTGLAFCPSARVSAIQPVPLASGKGTLTVSRPDTVTVCPIAPDWLTALTDCALPDGSCGEFTFGIYRGNDRIINWQEITQ
jgi:uncharacterized repeat protein (TIGR01451 family)